MIKILPTLAASLFLTIAPDILPEGMKGITVEVRVDASAATDDWCLHHVVQKGETLSAIAKDQLGDAARSKEIVALNPGLDADHLRIDQALWLPPKNVAATSKELVYAFFDGKNPGGHSIAPVVPGAVMPPGQRGQIGIYLVPAGQLAAFDVARVGRGAAVDELAMAGKIVSIPGLSPGRLVPRDDPTHQRRDTVRVEKDGAGKLALTVTSVAYDKDGKVLAKAAGTEPAKGTEPKKELLLLLLALGGGAVLLWRARRARLEPAMA